MQNLIDFLIKTKHWLVFFILEGFSLLFLYSFTGYQKSVFFTTANGIVGATYSAISSVTYYLNLQSENKSLEAANESLRLELIETKKKLRALQSDTTHAKWLIKKYHVVGAEIVGATLHKNNNLFTINKGEADGIRPEMGVISSNGVVGVVYMTSSHYSIVIPLLNSNSKISCRIRRTDNFGTVEWKRGRTDAAFVTGVPRHAKVKIGDVVETNGYSDIFPPGIPIGQVYKISDSPDGMSYLISTTLYNKFQTLREVSIITNYSQPERHALEQKADSLNKE